MTASLCSIFYWLDAEFADVYYTITTTTKNRQKQTYNTYKQKKQRELGLKKSQNKN